MVERRPASWTTVFYAYAASLLAGLACLWLIAHYGQRLPGSGTAGAAPMVGHAQSFWQTVLDELRRNFNSPVASSSCRS